ncbi:MAG: hypothetical protein Q4E88_02830 [Coriobacteriia bacterium]|nr:hypothetical protein [Coriobacteriia bacterium]
MTRKTCIKCKSFDNDYCRDKHIYLCQYYFVCKNYDPEEKLTDNVKKNCSNAYLQGLLNVRDSYEKANAKVIRLSENVSSPSLSEKITGSTHANSMDAKVIEYIEAEKDLNYKKERYEAEVKHFKEIIKDIPRVSAEVLSDYYLSNATGFQIAEARGITIRSFWRQLRKALVDLYDVLDEEYKRLSECQE